MSWETTSKKGPVESASAKVVKPPAAGDPTIRSAYCTEVSSSYVKKDLPEWARPRKVPPGQVAATLRDIQPAIPTSASQTTRSMKKEDNTLTTKSGEKVERFSSGYSTNIQPFRNGVAYDPVPHPLDLPPYLQRKALVSQRLELEGDVFGTMSQTSYTKPPIPEPNAPKSVAMELTGFARNSKSGFEDDLKDADVAERDFQNTAISPGSTMLPSMKLTAKKKNPLDAENDFRGPSRFSTTYNTYHKRFPLARGPNVHSANEFVTDSILSVGAAEPSGYSRSVVDLYAHQLSQKEAAQLEPSEEFIAQMDLGKSQKSKKGGGKKGSSSDDSEEGEGKPNPLIEDAAYYQTHPNIARNFRTIPPTISQLSYERPPQFTGNEAVPRNVFVEPTGATLAYNQSLGRALGSGRKEEWEDDDEDFIDNINERGMGEKKPSEQNGMGHEAEGMTREDILKIRAKDPMEFEYLRIGNTMKSVSQVSYPPHTRATAAPPMKSRDRDFMGTMSGKISRGKHLTPEEREAYVGSMQDRHYGLGTGKIDMGATGATSSALPKEPTGFTTNRSPFTNTADYSSSPAMPGIPAGTLALTPKQQIQAMVSKRLDYEGDVKGTIYQTDYVAPQTMKEKRREFFKQTSIANQAAAKAQMAAKQALEEEEMKRRSYGEEGGYTPSTPLNPTRTLSASSTLSPASVNNKLPSFTGSGRKKPILPPYLQNTSSSSSSAFVSTRGISEEQKNLMKLTSPMISSSQIGLGGAGTATTMLNKQKQRTREMNEGGMRSTLDALEEENIKKTASLFTMPDDYVPRSVNMEKSGYTRSIRPDPILYPEDD